MKKILLLLIIASSMLISNNEAKAQIEDTKLAKMDLSEYLGARLYKLFQTFGTPDDIACSNDERGEPILDFGKFAFQIGAKTVNIIYFWENYPGKVMGFKVGDSRADLEKKYGKPNVEKDAKDGSLIWIYNFKEIDRYFVVFFDDDAKIKKMQLELMI
jgi:hypothetical protein